MESFRVFLDEGPVACENSRFSPLFAAGDFRGEERMRLSDDGFRSLRAQLIERWLSLTQG